MSNLPVALNCSFDLTIQQESSFGFQKFCQEAFQAPLLSAEEEYQLAVRFQEENDLDAAHRLVHSYLRLVVKIATEYRNYRLSLSDLVQEGSLGLMVAVKKFDPKLGNRLASYAVWWIRASIHEFILRSWRMVKIATTQLKRQLFFKLRQAKDSALPLNWEEAVELARQFGTDAETILDVDGCMSGADTSLNQPLLESAEEMIHLLPDHRPNQEHRVLSLEQNRVSQQLLQEGLAQLSSRERLVIEQRFLSQIPDTLESLSQALSVSRERVRQLEKKALEKLRIFFKNSSEGRELWSYS
ncbi:MAG: RNA polymerase factor sigma-32 [Magnetococcus sp. DMHC-6]